MFIDWKKRQLNLKVVYYGPALSGKTTNLEYIYSHTDPMRRSELISLKTAEDRTLFFDFLQLELGKINGLMPQIQLYTVPGQTYYQASRKVVLKGADGVVFVADSSPHRLRDNIESWKNLHSHLRDLRIPVEQLPMVIQLNKQDAYHALSSTAIQDVFETDRYPVVGALAIAGGGVLETLKKICNGLIMSIQRNLV